MSIVGFLFFGIPIIIGLYALWYNFIQWNWGTYLYIWADGSFHKMRQCFGMDYHGENCYFDGYYTIWFYKRGIWARGFEITNRDLIMKMRLWHRYGEDAAYILRNCGL